MKNDSQNKIELVNSKYIKNIPDKRRDYYFRIIDNQANIHAITMRLFYLDSHFPISKLDTALLWLINNNLTGKKFVDWFENICKASDLELHRLLLGIVNNMPITKVIAGRNFRI